MKALRIFVLILMPILGCEKEYYWEYKIINQTSHVIQIEGYDRINIINDGRNSDIEGTLETIHIDPYKSFNIIRARGFQGDPLSVFNNMGIDSVNIIFSNEKILIQYCEQTSLRECNLPRNIAGYETVYEKKKIGRSSGENEYRFVYTITEEDYNNAIPIEE